jgi:hypothetical protein
MVKLCPSSGVVQRVAVPTCLVGLESPERCLTRILDVRIEFRDRVDEERVEELSSELR